MKLMNRNRREAGFSLLELLIVVAIILVIAAIAIPNLMSAKRAANQASAASELRTLVSAENIYRGNQTPQAYGVLSALAAADPANNGESYIDSKWETNAINPAVGDKGYVFADMGTADTTTFGFSAVPVGPSSGGFTYCVTQKGTLHRKAGTAAAVEAAPTDAPTCDGWDVVQ